MKFPGRPALSILVLVTTLVTGVSAGATEPTAGSWPPITPREKSLKADSREPYPAVILLEESVVNDRAETSRVQTLHRRIKILTAEGVPLAQVRISVATPVQDLLELEGRTVGEDGSEVALDPHSVLRTKHDDGTTEVEFKLPDAAPGAIVEYRYTMKGGRPPALFSWTFQHEIPCFESRFTWKPGLSRTSHWTLVGADSLKPLVTPITSEAAPESLAGVRFEAQDIPAAPIEVMGPPVLETRARLVTTYTDFVAGAVDYWDAFASSMFERQAGFSAKSDRLKEEIRKAVPAGGDFNDRVRAAYDFVQKNVGRSELGPGESTPSTADSVLARGAADPEGANLLFIAALLALDISATRGFVVDRDQAFFHREIQSPGQFSRTLVAITPGNGQAFFFAPGIPAAPPGVIPWYTEGVTALLAEKAGALFAPTPVDPPTVNGTTRTITLDLDERGNARMGVRVDYNGQPELEARSLDASDPKGFEASLRSDWIRRLPKARVDSFLVRNAGDLSRNLATTASLTVPGFGTPVDDRLLVNPSALSRETVNPFSNAARRTAVFLPYARVTTDNIRIQVPKGWKIDTLPEIDEFENEAGSYRALWSFDGDRVVYQRVFMLAFAHVPVEKAPALRALYDHVLQGDRTLLAFVQAPLPPSKR